MSTLGLIDRLIDAFEAEPRAHAAAPIQDGRRGNPVLLARSIFDRAMRLEGDEGARRLLAGLGPGEIIEIDAAGSDAAFDVDTPKDLSSIGQTRRTHRKESPN